MVEIMYRYRGREDSVFAKLEYYNPTGSIKDRIASSIFEKAAERGELKAGQPIIEVTSGNTGISFAAYGAYTKHPVHIFMPEWASEERKSLMKMYGAELHLVSRQEGGFLRAFEMADELAGEIGAYLPKQFDNPDNTGAHYHGTAAELLRQLPNVDGFVSGVGTGGTLMGIARLLKEKRNAEITAIEPDALRLLSGGKFMGTHKIEGIGDDFIPSIVDKSVIDNIDPVNDDDSIIMASRLARELGIGVGISSGANFLGCVRRGAPGKVMATVFADDNKKYLSTLLLVPPAAREGMLSPEIELLGSRTVTE